MIEYKLIRTNRTSMIYRVYKGELEVYAPLTKPTPEINEVLARNMDLINERMEIQRKQIEEYGLFSLTYGDSVTLLGKRCDIVAKNGDSVGFEDGCFYMPPGYNPTQVQAACAQIYRILAEQCIPKRTLEFAAAVGVKPSAVKISNARTKWGSCSPKKSLNFSWTLMMCEYNLVDYVIIHELAHLIELNHSPRFWAIVQALMPDYEVHKAKLWDEGKRIQREYWFE